MTTTLDCLTESMTESEPAPPWSTRLWIRLRHAALDDRGAVSIEYVIVAIALLAIAATIAAALDVLAADAVEQLPSSVSEAN